MKWRFRIYLSLIFFFVCGFSLHAHTAYNCHTNTLSFKERTNTHATTAFDKAAHFLITHSNHFSKKFIESTVEENKYEEDETGKSFHASGNHFHKFYESLLKVPANHPQRCLRNRQLSYTPDILPLYLSFQVFRI